MSNKREPWPVIFRMEGRKGSDWHSAIAFLPHDHVNHGMIGCYAHVGQHSEASLGYYQETKRAKPADYADLLAELRSIYETGDDAVTLVVKQRLPRDWREHAWKGSR